MKIDHSVKMEEADITELFNIPWNVALVPYASAELQEVAHKQALIQFENKLNAYAQRAFMFGEKIAEANADLKDTLMYS